MANTDIPDMISLLYLGCRSQSTVLDVFSREEGFSVHWADMDGPVPQDGYPLLPDLVLLEPGNTLDEAMAGLERLMAGLSGANAGPAPMVFLALDAYPDEDQRQHLRDLGVDEIVILPVTAEELRHRSRYYRQYKDLGRRHQSTRGKLDRSFQYLDRFKDALARSKQELVEEKVSLNHALKQVQSMVGQRSRMEVQLGDLTDEMGENSQGFIDLLYRLIQRRVEENRGHGKRVADIAVFLAKETGFKGKKLEDLQKAAMLHEVGLLLLSRLHGDSCESSRYSQDHLQQYPVKGAELLSQCKGFQGMAQILRHLNENADGTGYPDGLKRHNIPQATRILAGADVFDSLWTDPAMESLDDLFSALGELAGTRLDPGVVGQLEKYAVLHCADLGDRVRGVGVEDLEPGMELGTAVFTTSGTKLFSVGTVLTRELIDKLIQYNREYPVDETVYIKA